MPQGRSHGREREREQLERAPRGFAEALARPSRRAAEVLVNACRREELEEPATRPAKHDQQCLATVRKTQNAPQSRPSHA